MKSYQITFARSARKELEDLDYKIIRRVLLKIEMLSSNPRTSGCGKLQGDYKLWRIRAGDYRIIYSIDDKNLVVDIKRIRHRRDVYR